MGVMGVTGKKFGKTGMIFILLFSIAVVMVFLEYSVSAGGCNCNSSCYPNDDPNDSVRLGTVVVQKIRHGSLRGYRVIPEKRMTENVLLTFDRTDGTDVFYRALELGRRGYEVVLLSGYETVQGPVFMSRRPLAYFREFVCYARENGISLRSLTMSGCSVAEKILLETAVLFPH